MAHSNKRKLANILMRWPLTLRLSQTLWRRVVPPWMTAGAVGAVYNDAHQILIVEHVFHPRHPWGLPGGWMNRRESPAQTVERELREETGLQVVVERPLLIESTVFLPNHLDIAYLCRALPGEIRLSGELLDYRWIREADAPPMFAFHEAVFRLATAILNGRE